MKPRTRKAIAEIVAGLIPCDMARNRWRGLLRYGLLRQMALRRRMSRDKTLPEHYLAICAIAKNEGPYLDEWIEWHMGQGVEKFYIYDNESTDRTAEILCPWVEKGVVEYNFWPGQRQQLPAYDDCIERHRLDARWLAFLDLDEFVVPVRAASLADFLRGMEGFASVEINWLVYGSGGAQERTPGTVMQRFVRHSEPGHRLNRHVKSVVDPRRVACMVGCHEAARLCGRAATPDGRPVRANYNHRPPQHDIVRINHYAVKSFEEFLAKKARGRARTLGQRGMDYFENYDRNEVG